MSQDHAGNHPSAGRELPPPSAFAGDDGSADPALLSAVEALLAGHGTTAQLVATLVSARVLIPVMAELEHSGAGAAGLTVDKQASAGVVAVRAPDGRTALPVFSSVAALAAWSPGARPVPAWGRVAAASALQEGWELLVLDPAGAQVHVPRPALVAMAAGESWMPAVEAGAVRPDVRQAIVRALTGADAVVRVDAVPGRRAEVAVVIALRPGLDQGGLERVTRDAGLRLAADALVASAVDSVELRVVPGG